MKIYRDIDDLEIMLQNSFVCLDQVFYKVSLESNLESHTRPILLELLAYLNDIDSRIKQLKKED